MQVWSLTSRNDIKPICTNLKRAITMDKDVKLKSFGPLTIAK